MLDGGLKPTANMNKPSRGSRQPPMYASLHIPAFPLAVLLRDDPVSLTAPVALLGKSTGKAAPLLLAVNRPAARNGLAPGMTSTRALARCPRVRFLTPDPNREHDFQCQLREFAASLTPDFEETAPGTIILDLLTLPHARANPAAWIDQVLRRATALRLPLHFSRAATADLAHLAALAATTSSTLAFTPAPVIDIQPAEQTTSFLSHLPLATFQVPGSGFPLPNTELLHLWGIATLGQLAALPHQGLAERLGPDTARLHDILHGKHHRLLTLRRPPQHYQTKQDLEHPLDSLEPLLFLLKRALDTLCSRLRTAQRAAHTIHLSLTFDDGDLHLRELRVPEPVRDPTALLRLLHTHLDTLNAPSPVIAFSLKLLPSLPGESQHHLFERALRDPNKFADTLARIEAFLGPQRLGTPVPLDTHKPDSFDLRGSGVPPQAVPSASRRKDSSNQQPTSDNPRPSPNPPAKTALPLLRFRPPIPVRVATESRLGHRHPLALLDGPHPGPIDASHGPFPLSGHWWNPSERWQRVEWDVQLRDHTLLRLVHSPPGDWALEGTYR